MVGPEPSYTRLPYIFVEFDSFGNSAGAVVRHREIVQGRERFGVLGRKTFLFKRPNLLEQFDAFSQPLSILVSDGQIVQNGNHSQAIGPDVFRFASRTCSNNVMASGSLQLLGTRWPDHPAFLMYRDGSLRIV